MTSHYVRSPPLACLPIAAPSAAPLQIAAAPQPLPRTASFLPAPPQPSLYSPIRPRPRTRATFPLACPAPLTRGVRAALLEAHPPAGPFHRPHMVVHCVSTPYTSGMPGQGKVRDRVRKLPGACLSSVGFEEGRPLGAGRPHCVLFHAAGGVQGRCSMQGARAPGQVRGMQPVGTPEQEGWSTRPGGHSGDRTGVGLRPRQRRQGGQGLGGGGRGADCSGAQFYGRARGAGRGGPAPASAGRGRGAAAALPGEEALRGLRG
jgi:hypothetical protein